MKLSVIVPVYNVEQYIRPCVQSVYMQGLPEEEFELILVNDGTCDRSFEVIKDIISSHNNIVVLEQSNQGLSAARNFGLLRASGKYVLFLDSDDLLIDNTLSGLLALTNDDLVDLVIADFVKKDNSEIDFGRNIISMDYVTEKKNASEYFLYDFNPRQCYVWRSIYRKGFLDDNKLRFVPDIYFEDVPFTTECLIKADKCVKTTLKFYIYRQRENSIVSSISLKKILDFNTVIAKLWDMFVYYPLSSLVRSQLMNTIFATFSISVWYISSNPLLLSQRKLIVSDLKCKVPNLYFSNGIKQKIISCIYHIAPCFYIKLRSIISII